METESTEKITWDSMDLNEDLLRGIYATGFEAPSTTQIKSIPLILKKKDAIVQAQSGTGKTASFSISMLQQIDTSRFVVQGMIIAPTHELARQIASVVTGLGAYCQNLRTKLVLGGTSIQDEARDLQENTPHIIIGCAGRIYDMIRRRYLSCNELKMIVLDEADEMLSSGFKVQMYNIFQYITPNTQVVLFSATLPEDIIELTQKFMVEPNTIIVKAEELTLECIEQHYIALQNDKHKFEMLKNIFSMISLSQCIIYCNSVKRVVDLYNAMTSDQFSVCAIHSSMDKAAREQVFSQFRNGNYRVLISSNITARGIDVQQVSTVINFDVPRCVHTYLHRIGRSGRWGRKGLAINFITQYDVDTMRKIEDHYKIQITELSTKV
jgi:superfamily II DNA/RNA helicase